jgi:hypothetical protein
VGQEHLISSIEDAVDKRAPYCISKELAEKLARWVEFLARNHHHHHHDIIITIIIIIIVNIVVIIIIIIIIIITRRLAVTQLAEKLAR